MRLSRWRIAGQVPNVPTAVLVVAACCRLRRRSPPESAGLGGRPHLEV